MDNIEFAYLIEDEKVVEIFRFHDFNDLHRALEDRGVDIQGLRINEDEGWILTLNRFTRGVFSGRPASPPPHALRGVTPFQRRVLELTRLIPPGRFTTYGELGKPFSPRHGRAVGQVMAMNPLPFIIPCHRVLASNLRLGGFGLGLEVKRGLLRAEKGASRRVPRNLPFKTYSVEILPYL